MYALSWDLPISVLYGIIVGGGFHALVGWAFFPPSDPEETVGTGRLPS